MVVRATPESGVTVQLWPAVLKPGSALVVGFDAPAGAYGKRPHAEKLFREFDYTVDGKNVVCTAVEMAKCGTRGPCEHKFVWVAYFRTLGMLAHPKRKKHPKAWNKMLADTIQTAGSKKELQGAVL